MICLFLFVCYLHLIQPNVKAQEILKISCAIPQRLFKSSLNYCCLILNGSNCVD